MGQKTDSGVATNDCLVHFRSQVQVAQDDAHKPLV